MVFKWKRSQIELLISLVEQNPSIYDVTSVEYSDRVKKAQSFNRILQEMRRIESTMTIDEIKRKWKNLRTQYTQELRGINQAKKSGAIDSCTPKLWCFEELAFLKPHIEIRACKNSSEDDANKKFCISNGYEDDSLSQQHPMKRLNEQGTIHVFRRNGFESFKNISNQIKVEKKYDWLGALVANQMEEICPEDQADAAWEVQCLMRRLTSESYQKQNPSSTPTSDMEQNYHFLEIKEDCI